MTITVTAQMQQPYRHTITTGAHTFYADVAPDKGGQDSAPNPHELLLGALGACTAMTIQMYAQRKGWKLDDVSVQLDEGKTSNAAGVSIPQIIKNIQLRGNLSPDQIQALKVVAEKCPVNKLLMGEKQMTSALNVLG